jgi:hypothetical protein
MRVPAIFPIPPWAYPPREFPLEWSVSPPLSFRTALLLFPNADRLRLEKEISLNHRLSLFCSVFATKASSPKE